MKPLYIAIVLLVMFSVSGNCQQDPLYTQYMHNPVSINPAFSGFNGTLNAVSLYRHQWAGFDGAPRVVSLAVNAPIPYFDIGIGFDFIHQVIGPLVQTGFYTDYSYTIRVSESSKLAFGLKGGFNYTSFDLTSLHRDQVLDDLLDNYGSRRFFRPNVGIGALLYSDTYYAAFSVPKMIRNSLSGKSNGSDDIKEDMHFFISGGAIFEIRRDIHFKPTFTSRMVWGAPSSTEITCAFLFGQRIWTGIMYRFVNAVGALVQFHVQPGLKIGYAYDLTHNTLGAYNSGTHEILISYDLASVKKKIYTPRFF